MARVRDDRGQLVPLLALVVLVGCVATLWAVRLGAGAVARARAQTAADAAALGAAGVPEGRGEDEARRLAAANGGELITYLAAGPTVRVEVRIGPARATATAERSRLGAGRIPPYGAAVRAGLARARQVLGRPVAVLASGPGWVEVSPVDAAALTDRRNEIGLCPTGTHVVVCRG